MSLYERLLIGRMREHRTLLLEALDDIAGDIYLWRLGEIDAETAMSGVRDAVEGLPWWVAKDVRGKTYIDKMVESA